LTVHLMNYERCHWLWHCLLGSNFFFSSRRRHTRSKRDWSSDVCSSDLAYELIINPTSTHQVVTAPTMKQAEETMGPLRTAISRRSEERRVGKEWRRQRTRKQCKKNGT